MCFMSEDKLSLSGCIQQKLRSSQWLYSKIMGQLAFSFQTHQIQSAYNARSGAPRAEYKGLEIAVGNKLILQHVSWKLLMISIVDDEVLNTFQANYRETGQIEFLFVGECVCDIPCLGYQVKYSSRNYQTVNTNFQRNNKSNQRPAEFLPTINTRFLLRSSLSTQ